MQNPETLPILYSFRRCPYAIRARLALAACGQEVELREVILRDKPPEFLATSPTATVPCMKLPDGTVIDESLDIMIWASGRNDPHDLRLAGTGSYTQMIALIDRCEDDFKPHLDRYKYASRFEDADAAGDRVTAAAFLYDLDARLRGQAYLFGNRRSLADVGIAPFVRQFAHVDQDWFHAQEWPDLIRWLDAFKASWAFKSIMTKYPQWKAGDPMTIFPVRKRGE